MREDKGIPTSSSKKLEVSSSLLGTTEKSVVMPYYLLPRCARNASGECMTCHQPDTQVPLRDNL